MRDVSLFVAYWLLEAKQLASFTRQNCLFIVSVDARRFASIAISSGSGTFRFHDHNNGTHESLQKSHYVRRNFFAYYANR